MPGEMSGGEETVPPRDQSSATSKRASRTARVALAVVVTGLLVAGVVVSCRTVQSIFDCSPPTQGELETQQAFVQAHLGDASEFELGAARARAVRASPGRGCHRGDRQATAEAEGAARRPLRLGLTLVRREGIEPPTR